MERAMSSLKEFQCEICGTVSQNPSHWFVIECGDALLSVIKWDLAAANTPTARHFCGEGLHQPLVRIDLRPSQAADPNLLTRERLTTKGSHSKREK
jgi:hypothetical protein